MSLKKTKTNKIDQQKNKPIKYNYMEKKNDIKLIKKNKILISQFNTINFSNSFFSLEYTR
jgi:hypothetical protein